MIIRAKNEMDKAGAENTDAIVEKDRLVIGKGRHQRVSPVAVGWTILCHDYEMHPINVAFKYLDRRRFTARIEACLMLAELPGRGRQ